MGWGINSMFQANVTLVANAFIDEYLALANGDYVKVYLFLLRHQDCTLEVADVAEALHYTEGDVKRAIAYWEKEGVLAVNALSKTLFQEEEKEPPDEVKTVFPLEANLETGASLAVPLCSPDLISQLSDDEEFSQLLYIAQKYMNKVFTQRECQIFAYLYEELKLPADLLEYLIEYCVQNNHSNIRYMETVALDWHQKGIVTVEAAKDYSIGFNKNAFAVMRAFGLNDRRPGEPESQFITSWFVHFGFSQDLVVEACNRTIRSIHTPSFSYANKILTDWNNAGVKTLEDVEKLDVLREEQEKKQQSKNSKRKISRASSMPPAVNRFHNFEQSTTDYDSLMIEKVRARMQNG